MHIHAHTCTYIHIPADTYIYCMYVHVCACIACMCRYVCICRYRMYVKVLQVCVGMSLCVCIACMRRYCRGLQIFIVCTYLFVIFGSNIQCTVLGRRISAFINNRQSIEGMTKFIHKIKCICLDILSSWAYIRRCTELPEFFFFILFFHFWLQHTMYSHGGCLSTCSNMIKKSWTVPNLGVIVFAHTRISRDIRLWELRFSYISRYTTYFSRYTIMGNLSRGSRFQMKAGGPPPAARHSWSHFAMGLGEIQVLKMLQ